MIESRVSRPAVHLLPRTRSSFKGTPTAVKQFLWSKYTIRACNKHNVMRYLFNCDDKEAQGVEVRIYIHFCQWVVAVIMINAKGSRSNMRSIEWYTFCFARKNVVRGMNDELIIKSEEIKTINCSQGSRFIRFRFAILLVVTGGHFIIIIVMFYCSSLWLCSNFSLVSLEKGG